MASRDISSQLDSITKASFTSEIDRKRAVDSARALIARIESPVETAFRLGWITPTLVAMLRTASQMKLFDSWMAFNGGKAASEEQLAKLVPADRPLLRRVLNMLAANQALEFTANESNQYELTEYGQWLATPEGRSCLNIIFDFQTSAFDALPEFLEKSGFQNPINSEKNVWADLKGQGFISWLQANPPIFANLSLVMKATAEFRGSLVRDFPSEEIVAKSDPEGKLPLIVDIGGSLGHDLSAFNAKHPQPSGQLIVQDLASVLEMNKDLNPALKAVPIDFFKEAPVNGAAFYYMHAVLHDWPDTESLAILGNVSKAMIKGRSKLLVHDVVVDSKRPTAEQMACDITMLGMASGKERTEDEWTKLLADGGFVIKRILRTPLSSSALIEAELA